MRIVEWYECGPTEFGPISKGSDRIRALGSDVESSRSRSNDCVDSSESESIELKSDGVEVSRYRS